MAQATFSQFHRYMISKGPHLKQSVFKHPPAAQKEEGGLSYILLHELIRQISAYESNPLVMDVAISQSSNLSVDDYLS